MYNVIAGLILFSLSFTSSAQLTITSAQTAQALAQKLAGNGVVVSNAVLTCPNIAYGSFTATNFTLDSGIVLTTGIASTQSGYWGVNGAAGNLASFNNGAAGDATLNSLSGQNTHDACALEFDIVPQGDSLKFQYIFSSEEYTNATCGQYNDAFAFFISGPGITGQQNMAQVPGTNIPVTINSINSGIPGPGFNLSNCTSMGPGSPFTGYFIDNTNGQFITHKGMTTLLDAKRSVLPCSTYHLKMVIADAGNFLYDSGVFIRAGSLQSSGFKLRTVASTNQQGKKFIVKGCSPATLRFSNKQSKPYPQTLRLVLSGTAVNGFDYAQLADSIVVPAYDTAVSLIVSGLPTPENGVKTLNIYLKSPYSCTAGSYIDSASIDILDTLHASLITPDTAICAGDSIQLRMLGDDILQYTWQPSVHLSNNTIKEPKVAPVATTTYTFTASLPGSGCAQVTGSITVAVSPVPVIVKPDDISQCNHLPLSLNVQVTPPYPNYVFQWTGPGGYTSSLQNPVIPNGSSVNSGTYVIKVSADTSLCSATSGLQVTITSPDTPAVRNPYILCLDGKTITLEAQGENLLWYTDPNGTGAGVTPQINTAILASYQYYVSQTVNNCESDRVPVLVEVKKCCDGDIFIPSGFTPNNDGRNDVFRLNTGYGYKVIQFHIFNRWGQLVYNATDNIPWDGNFMGEPAEVGTYYYEILIGCTNGATTQKKGEVLLIR